MDDMSRNKKGVVVTIYNDLSHDKARQLGHDQHAPKESKVCM